VIRLAVHVGEDPDGVVLAELMELSPGGVEEHDGPDGLQYVLYGAPGELPELPDSQVSAGGRLLAVTSSEVADDWDERWKQWHQPVELTGRHGRMRIRPPWEPSLHDDELVVDPGQAFGTGAHATTRLCLELLLDLEVPEDRALADWGCGTGVLAIAAHRLGYGPVVAVDHDPLAVTATIENAAVNHAVVEAYAADLRDAPLPPAPTVCANLLRPLLLECARTMVEPPRVLIASGLLAEEGDEVAEAFARHGLVERDRRHAAEWCALLLAQPG
jgi:ribosomal protein L11 methyltransferase